MLRLGICLGGVRARQLIGSKRKGKKKKKTAKLFFSSLIFPVLSQSLVPQVEEMCRAKPVPSAAAAAAAAAKSLQLCLTLCDPIDDSPPDSIVPGILQARILEWVAISFSNA